MFECDCGIWCILLLGRLTGLRPSELFVCLHIARLVVDALVIHYFRQAHYYYSLGAIDTALPLEYYSSRLKNLG